MAQTLGLTQINWNGANVPIKKGSKLKLGGLNQKSTVTGSQVDYYSVYEASELTATTPLHKGDSLLSLFAPGSGPIVVTCDTGQTYSGFMFLTERPSFTSGDDGQVSLKWEGGELAELIG